MITLDDTKCFLCGKQQTNRYGSVVKPHKHGILYKKKVVDVPLCYDCSNALSKNRYAVVRRIKKNLELLVGDPE